MANIWTENRHNNENRGQLFSTNAKQFLSARKHSVKKQVFGELKNVIHNQGGPTPFKGTNSRDGLGAAGPSKSLCADVLRKQQLRCNFSDAQRKLEKKLKPVEVAPAPSLNIIVHEDPIFDDLEIPVNPCNGDCEKSLEEIWGNMNKIDDDFLNKVINGGDPDSDSEEDKDYFRQSEDAIEPADDLGCLSRTRNLFWNSEDSQEMNDDLPIFHFEMPNHPDMLDAFDF